MSSKVGTAWYYGAGFPPPARSRLRRSPRTSLMGQRHCCNASSSLLRDVITRGKAADPRACCAAQNRPSHVWHCEQVGQQWGCAAAAPPFVSTWHVFEPCFLGIIWWPAPNSLTRDRSTAEAGQCSWAVALWVRLSSSLLEC